jgi:hypothetical protein
MAAGPDPLLPEVPAGVSIPVCGCSKAFSVMPISLIVRSTHFGGSARS